MRALDFVDVMADLEDHETDRYPGGDLAVWAFRTDLEDLGLADSTLIATAGEFGRRPALADVVGFAHMEQPTPDDADWTWVLERPCPDCGFDSTSIDREQLGAKFRANAAAWRTVLNSGDRVSVRPPAPQVQWSALEYGAHVRDVYARFVERVELMLSEDAPRFANWDQDATALEERYWEQDPGRVAYALAVNAGKLADTYDRVGGDEWDRTGLRSDGSAFTVETLGRYCLHDPVHHLWDVAQGFEAIDEADG